MKAITVIFDGECEFCKQSLMWIERKLVVTALAFQSADLQTFNLTREQCAKQLYVVDRATTYAGADAIAFLLARRGNTILSRLLTALGPIGRAGYRWVASHRNTWPIKVATRVLKARNSI